MSALATSGFADDDTFAYHGTYMLESSTTLYFYEVRQIAAPTGCGSTSVWSSTLECSLWRRGCSLVSVIALFVLCRDLKHITASLELSRMIEVTCCRTFDARPRTHGATSSALGICPRNCPVALHISLILSFCSLVFVTATSGITTNSGPLQRL